MRSQRKQQRRRKQKRRRMAQKRRGVEHKRRRMTQTGEGGNSIITIEVAWQVEHLWNGLSVSWIVHVLARKMSMTSASGMPINGPG